MAWLSLIFAGLFEIGWPLGLKFSQEPGHRFSGITLSILSIILSGLLLWIAQKSIPIGTAYAVWTGIGTVGTFAIGIFFYGDASSFSRLLGAGLIIAGIILLRFSP